MTTSSDPSPEDRFFQLLARPKYRVSERARPHYFRRVEEWKRFCLRSENSSPSEVTREFFECLGARTDFEDWQFWQAIKAVELWATEIEKVPWSFEFDWFAICRTF